MESFSQRQGIKPMKNIVQIDSMDNDLRNSLWNALTLYYWSKVTSNFVINDCTGRNANNIINNMDCLTIYLQIDYFKTPIDTLTDYLSNFKVIKAYFFNCKWNEVYDFIEFIADNYPDEETNLKFREECNIYLEREVSAYRFVNGLVSQITSEVEINSIEEVLELQGSLKPVTAHIRKSLSLLSDRKCPDYRNSIKESISAVEAACKLITNDKDTTLGKALNKIENKVGYFHPALKQAFDKLYGYTSDADGIRHALLEESKLCFEDAKFMLVACSGFTNFLVSKSIQVGDNF